MILENLQAEWVDTPEYHKFIHEMFINLVNKDDQLNAHRTWIEQNIFGFGERSFWWMWKLICDELPEDSKLLEIGVFKGATLSVWRLLKPLSRIYGISPMNGIGTGWTDDDYDAHIKTIHDKFDQKNPVILRGVSNAEYVIDKAGRKKYDVVYIDGGHERADIDNDLLHYAPMVKQGGYLVIDDACCDFHMPWGYFQGINEVCDGVLAYMEDHGNEWEFIFSVVHLRIYKRK